MAKIMFTWELGGGFGHLYPYQKVIGWLLAQGHQVAFVVRNLSNAEAVFEHSGVELLQIPVVNQPGVLVPRPRSYVDVLHNQGWTHRNGLGDRITGWHRLYEQWRPEILIMDHSPTAALATQLFAGPERILSGNGFTLPPLTRPMPVFPLPAERVPVNVVEREQALLEDVVNPVIKSLGGSAFAALKDAFDTEHRWLRSLPGMDQLPVGREDSYLGVDRSTAGISPEWPDVTGPRVFAYLRDKGPLLNNLIGVLNQLGYPSLIYDGVGREKAPEDISDNVRLAHTALNIGEAAAMSQLAITHAGHTTTAQMLLQGVPLILIPQHIEQTLTALSIEQLGAGRAILSNRDYGIDVAGLINGVIAANSSERQAAIEFASRFVTIPDAADTMVSRLNSILSPATD